jgi:hypothetical protein
MIKKLITKGFIPLKQHTSIPTYNPIQYHFSRDVASPSASIPFPSSQ